jgi:cytochrome P450
VDEEHAGPAQLDPGEYFRDWGAELERCAHQHWWAQGMDMHGTPTAVVLTWDASRAVLTDRRLSPRSFVDDMVAGGLSRSTALQVAPLFSRHGDDHRHLRAVLSKAFTPKSVEQVRPATRTIAERLAEGIAASGESCEFVAAFAKPLPPQVFAILFGLPVEDSDRLARWAATIALAFDPSMPPEHVALVEEAAAEMRAYGLERIAISRDHPGDDLVSRLLEAEVDGHHLSEDDVIAMITGFVFAGSETTRRQLTAAVQLLAECPDAWERLAAEPDLLPNAVEEILRHRGIISGLTRRAEQPFEHDDLSVAEGGRIMLAFDMANRDPSRFEEPGSFVVDRPDAHAHLTFGWGPHLCVGAGLARLELNEGLGALTRRFRPPILEEVGESTGMGAADSLRVRLRPR